MFGALSGNSLLGYGPKPSEQNALFSGARSTLPFGILSFTTEPNALIANKPSAELRDRPKPLYLEWWAAPNYGDELQKSYWTAEEFVALLLGISPRFGTMHDFEKNHLTDNVAWEGMRLYNDVVRRAIEVGDIQPYSRPSTWLAWALASSIEIPADLVDIATKRRLVGASALESIDRLQRALDDARRQIEVVCVAKDGEINGLNKKLASTQALNRDLTGLAGKCVAFACIALKQVCTHSAAAAAPSPSVTTPTVVEHSGSTVAPAASAPQHSAKSASTKLSGASRKYNTAAYLFHMICRRHYSLDEGRPNADQLKKIRSDIQELGGHVDDETLSDHLLAGSSEHAKRSRKS